MTMRKMLPKDSRHKIGRWQHCLLCNTEFFVFKYRYGIAKYCSYKCSNNARRLKRSFKNCAVCSKKFEIKPDSKRRNENSKFCSKYCRDNRGLGFRGGVIKVKCVNCDKEFDRRRVTYNRSIRKGAKQFCGWACSIQYNRKQSNVTGPNKAEQLLIPILAKYRLKFVGDGSFMLGRKNPDFVNKKRKLIVELFGEHWHTKEEMCLKKRCYKQYGYRSLFIWWKELKSLGKVEQRVKEFCKEAA